MNGNSKKTLRVEAYIEFTNQDYLRLLQLKTRQAIFQRLQSQKSTSTTKEEKEKKPFAKIPERWQFIPDDISLYNWQRECLKIWLEKGKGTVKVATGGGKTLFAMAAIQRLQNTLKPDLRVAIIVPTIPLMFQWYDEIRKGNLPESAIGLLGGGHQIDSLEDICLLIAVINSARVKLAGLVKKANWSDKMLLIVDECHRSNARQAQKIFDASPAYALGLSATPEPELQDEELLSNEAYETSPAGKTLGPIIYDFTVLDALKAGLLTPFEVYHIGLPLSPEEAERHARLSKEIRELRKKLEAIHRRSKTRQGFLAWCQSQASHNGQVQSDAERFIFLSNERKRLLYRAQSRTEAVLAILLKAIKDPDSRAIVFHESISEIEFLFQEAYEKKLPAVLEHSQLPSTLRDENIEAFRRGIARIIISAKSLIEGFNVPSADIGIIAASSSSVRQRIQSLGRMLRRKSGNRQAKIYVLYIKDTEDEAIYEKADWENIIGAEQNRYFVWHPPDKGKNWESGLQETNTPPRIYRPPSFEVDVSNLRLGDPYPGQRNGIDLRVDGSLNLRTLDGRLVKATNEQIKKILENNLHRRARCTPAGHLIVRKNDSTDDWIYIGTIEIPSEESVENVISLKIQTISGRKEISRKQKRFTAFALGPDKCQNPEAGRTRDNLLRWIETLEREHLIRIDKVFWDGKQHYWVELKGKRIHFPGPAAELEFAQ